MHRMRTPLLLWASLLLSVRDSNAGPLMREWCSKGFCVTLDEGEITSEAGLCVVVPCSFNIPYYFTPQHLVWYKCPANKQRCSDSDTIFHTNKNNMKVQAGFKGRVTLLESDLLQRNCSIMVNDLTESDSGEYQLRVNRQRDGWTFSPRVTVSVKALSQKPTVRVPPLTEGQQTTLTCTAPGLCSGSPPTITWMWKPTGDRESHLAGNVTDLVTEEMSDFTQRHVSTLTFKASSEHHHHTNVTCVVNFTGNVTTEETVTLTVIWFPKILRRSGCVVQAVALTCECISQGDPLPTITWPLLENLTEYRVITTVANNTVSSTISLSVKDDSDTSVECFSSHGNWTAKKNLRIQRSTEKIEDENMNVTFSWLKILFSFVIGVLFSSVICCLSKKCHRKKQKASGNLSETLEMLTTPEDSQRDAYATVENVQTHHQNVSKYGAEDANNGVSGSKDVEYASIDFSLLKVKSPGEAAKREESTKTEYAEIKKEEKVQRHEGGGEPDEILERNQEEDAFGEDDEDVMFYAPEKEEDMAIYSNLEETVGEICEPCT
ncbi:uncharacterized protein ACBR49_005172 [Aulostomus maculatus]